MLTQILPQHATTSFRFLGLAVSLLLIAVYSAAAQGQFHAGAAARSIQPKLPVPVSGGMGAPSMATQAKGELMARAVAFRSGDQTIAICCVDVLGFPSVLCDRVRSKIKGIQAENVLIASTHTHSAPDCYAFPDGKGGHTGDLKYIEFVVQQTADAVQSAIESMKPAKLKVASGNAEGKIAYNYYAPALYDKRMGVLQAIDMDSKTIFTLVNYAIHPEVLGNEVGIVSPDVVGPLCETLEQTHGGTAIFLNGALGGMITADNRELDKIKDPLGAVWSDSRTWEECTRIGNLMASEASRIVANAATTEAPKLKYLRREVSFPIDSDILWQVFSMSPLGYSAKGDQRVVTVPVVAMRLGECQIATIPGEALPNIGFYLKRKMSAKHQFLFGLTNDAFGYILTRVDFASFPRYDYVSRVCLGEMTGEILIENLVAMLEELDQ